MRETVGSGLANCINELVESVDEIYGLSQPVFGTIKEDVLPGVAGQDDVRRGLRAMH
jgi:hypothetical protein